jgi:hypothetical protein
VENRDTVRLPLFGFIWLPFMPSWTFLGQKVDYCQTRHRDDERLLDSGGCLIRTRGYAWKVVLD